MENKNSKQNDVIPWAKSDAKQYLRNAIIQGLVTKSTPLEEVLQMNSAFSNYPKANFKRNLKALLESIDKDQERANSDAAAVEHDLAQHPRAEHTTRNLPFWDGSRAQELLKIDIANGVHLQMTKKEFWMSKEEYQLFPLPNFRNAIYQEVRSKKAKSYWSSKKKLMQK
jgi:hypothetical protein